MSGFSNIIIVFFILVSQLTPNVKVAIILLIKLLYKYVYRYSQFTKKLIMKLLVLASLVTYTLCADCPPSGEPGDNSNYIPGKSRCIWFPQDNGEPILVDLDAAIDTAFLNSYDASFNEYWLFTRYNPTTPQILTYEDENSVRDSNYDANRATVVITHGWFSDGNSKSVTAIRDAFMNATDRNIIVLDWRKLASKTYKTAAIGVPSVGEYAGKFMKWLFETVGGGWDFLNMIGHGLGAHVVGNAGRAVGGKSSRVTGLDPAGPLWKDNPYALSATDAQYTECIHTDGERLGIMNPICEANFYPNGGQNPQPGCLISNCSHNLAPQLMASSVLNDFFLGRRCLNIDQAKEKKCDGTVFNMGNSILDKRGSGLYGLLTSGTWPYYLS